MISAMALMPIPPMPRMCTGPMSSGICMRVLSLGWRPMSAPFCDTLRASRLAAYQLLHEVGKANYRIRPSVGSGGVCRPQQGLRRGEEAGDGLGEGLRRQLLLLDAPGAAGVGKPAGIL